MLGENGMSEHLLDPDHMAAKAGDKRLATGFDESVRPTKQSRASQELPSFFDIAIPNSSDLFPPVHQNHHYLPIDAIFQSGSVPSERAQPALIGWQSEDFGQCFSGFALHQEEHAGDRTLQLEPLCDSTYATSSSGQDAISGTSGCLFQEDEYSMQVDSYFPCDSIAVHPPTTTDDMTHYAESVLRPEQRSPMHYETVDEQRLDGQRRSASTVEPDEVTDHQTECASTDSDIRDGLPEMCFGALTETIKISYSQQTTHDGTTLDLRPSGEIILVHSEDTGSYIGILSNATLSKLISDRTVRICATLVFPETKPQTKPAKNKIPDVQRQSCIVRMIVYGTSDDKVMIANMLSDAGLYLQQPFIHECYRDTIYDNPHYLVRPGSRMPALVSSASIGDVETMPESLHETAKHELMKVFDSVGDSHVSPSTLSSHRLMTPLKMHQQKALAFMVEKERGLTAEPNFPPLWEKISRSAAQKKYRHAVTGVFDDAPRSSKGGVLADDMGLGKSLSLLSLICVSLDAAESQNSDQKGQSLATLIVTPKSTIPGWQNQIDKHIYPGRLRLNLYHGSGRQLACDGHIQSDVVITTYETLRSEWETNGPLASENWYRVVLDEAHHIRNRSSRTFNAACALRSPLRWCLTGTPIQNSLDDFGALMSFVGLTPFISKSAFDFWITSAVTAGNPEGLRRLRKLIEVTCLRRTKFMVNDSCHLLERIESIKYVDLTPQDREPYEFFREKTVSVASGFSKLGVLPGEASRKRDQPKVIVLINVLRLICDHGERLLPASAVKSWENRSIATKDWRDIQRSVMSCQMCGVEVDTSQSLPRNVLESHDDSNICDDCALENGATLRDDSVGSPPPVSEASPRLCDLNLNSIGFRSMSAKVQALVQNLVSLRQEPTESDRYRPQKSVVFSFWTNMLDLIQEALQAHDFVTQRIDGQMTLDARSRAISIFDNDPSCTVMLASIRSTGEGVDFKVANVVHLMEPQWNPMFEAQAVDRVHRIGQDREVQVIRYVANDSIETYVRWLQLDKLRLINQSLDSCTSQQQQEANERRLDKLRESLQNHSGL